MNAENQTEETVETVVPEKSKGQLYKDQHGHSKTLKRNMWKRGLNSLNPEQVEAYKIQRRLEKKVIRKIQVEKHSKASAIRKSPKTK